VPDQQPDPQDSTDQTPGGEATPADPTSAEPTESATSAAVLVWRRLACGLVGLQALFLALAGLYSLVVLLTGGDWLNNLLVGGLFVLCALALGFIARELLRGHRRVRTPGVFFQALLLLLVPSMWSAGNPVLAAGVGLLAGLAVVSIVLATRRP
jgi:hypothetical protein